MNDFSFHFRVSLLPEKTGIGLIKRLMKKRMKRKRSRKMMRKKQWNYLLVYSSQHSLSLIVVTMMVPTVMENPQKVRENKVNLESQGKSLCLK